MAFGFNNDKTKSIDIQKMINDTYITRTETKNNVTFSRVTCVTFTLLDMYAYEPMGIIQIKGLNDMGVSSFYFEKMNDNVYNCYIFVSNLTGNNKTANISITVLCKKKENVVP